VHLVVLLVVAGVAWGSTMVLAKLAVGEGHAALGVAWWQAALGAVLLLALTRLRGRRLPVGRSHLLFYGVCGMLGTAIPHSVSFTTAAHLPAGVLAVIVAMVPVFTYLIAVPIGAERVSVLRILGTLLGIVAILILVSPTTDLSGDQVKWVLIGLVSPLCYALENLYIDRALPRGLDPIASLCGMSLAALAILTPVVLARGEFIDLFGVWGVDDAAVVGMALVHIAAYATLIYLINAAGPVFASQLAYIVTLSGVAWGMVVFGESHAGGFWIALVLLVGGLALVKPRRVARAVE